MLEIRFRLFYACLIFYMVSLLLQGCRHETKTPENFLHARIGKPLYSAFNVQSYKMAIRMRLEHESRIWSKYPWLVSYYKNHQYEPCFTSRFFADHQLDSLVIVLRSAHDDGLKASYYHPGTIDSLISELGSEQVSLIDAYLILSRLELETARSAGMYAHDLQFGRVNPVKLYKARFSLKFKQAGSQFYDSIFTAASLPAYLRTHQPSNPVYLKLRDSLASFRRAGRSQPGSYPLSWYISKLKVNMERLRWRPEDTSSTYVMVNIPDYTLYAIQENRILWTMKVCLGEKKEDGYDLKLKTYQETGNIDDRPLNHQTPLLNSQFNFIQLNPRWNIPSSILQNELYYKLRMNPGYLAENNMKLYRGNKEVGRLDTINWARIPRGKIPFHVKQDAGEFNALGKLKFSFLNPYSIYLHDTPNKHAFQLKTRDVSHGCVRVADPLKLAAFLTRYNPRNTMDLIRIAIGMEPEDTSATMTGLYEKKLAARDLNHEGLKTSSIYLRRKTSLFIQYYTCWVDGSGKLSFMDDIYDLDPKIQQAL